VPNGAGPTGVVERGRSYRGVIEATAGAGPLRLINQLDVETYLKGMGEVPSSWPAAAIGAQSIVARTYALRAMSFSGEICDYDLCQVYIGAGRETASQNAAVDATRGQVVTFGGQLASSVYSADAGGVSANTFEGFGTPEASYPYLTTVHYETDNPLPWHTDIALADVARRFAYPGSVTNVTISKSGPSGRALEVTIDGTSGPVIVDGRKFASRLGLRSTLFTPVIGTANAAPPPPADIGGIQALPEDTAAIMEAATLGETAFDSESAAKKDASGDKAIAALLATDFLPDGTDVASSRAALVAGIFLAAATAVACGQTRRQSRTFAPGGARLR
jgi:stage II sporulation protein D